jgi:hypothetical protein
MSCDCPEPDVYLAVPLANDGVDDVVHPSVRASVYVGEVETPEDNIDEDVGLVVLHFGDHKDAMTLALEILRQVKDEPGEGAEVRISAVLDVDEFQCERLTEEEARSVHERFLKRMEEPVSSGRKPVG